jgi:hypothetical protein
VRLVLPVGCSPSPPPQLPRRCRSAASTSYTLLRSPFDWIRAALPPLTLLTNARGVSRPIRHNVMKELIAIAMRSDPSPNQSRWVGVNFDQRCLRQRRSEVFGMIKAHGAVVPGGQDQHRLSDIAADIGWCTEINKKPSTGPARQQELGDLSTSDPNRRTAASPSSVVRYATMPGKYFFGFLRSSWCSVPQAARSTPGASDTLAGIRPLDHGCLAVL